MISPAVDNYLGQNNFRFSHSSDDDSLLSAVLQQLQYADRLHELKVTAVSDFKQLVLKWLEEHDELVKYKPEANPKSWALYYDSKTSMDVVCCLLLVACAHISQCSIRVFGPTAVKDTFWIELHPTDAASRPKATLQLMFHEDKLWSIEKNNCQKVILK